jgi:hypothetical protein
MSSTTLAQTSAADAAILFAVFNRPDQTRRVFDAIRAARPKRLFVTADGPRPRVPGDAARCEETRRIATAVDWDCQVVTRFSATNLGVKQALSSGISWFFEQVEEGIILEDDCLPDVTFFSFCAELLERYRDDQRIMQISGSNFLPAGTITPQNSYYCTAINDIWGWATWRRAWQHFDLGMPGYSQFRSEGRIQSYFGDRAIADWMQSYFDEAELYRDHERIGIWSSPWSYAMCRQGGFTLAPSHNLVANIGIDGDATNSGASFRLYDQYVVRPMGELQHPPTLEVNHAADRLRFELIRKTDPRLDPRQKLRRRLAALLPASMRGRVKAWAKGRGLL